MTIKRLIRTVLDFPRPGIRFRDITPLLADAAGFREVVDALAERYRGKVDKVAAIEARGFIFGAALAHAIGAGFVPFRKPGRLPHTLIGHDYELEYGTNRVEVHVDGVAAGERVVVIDDLIATGGTAAATAALVSRLGGTVVECAFVIELSFLNGREKLKPYGVYSLIQYDSE